MYDVVLWLFDRVIISFDRDKKYEALRWSVSDARESMGNENSSVRLWKALGREKMLGAMLVLPSTETDVVAFNIFN